MLYKVYNKWIGLTDIITIMVEWQSRHASGDRGMTTFFRRNGIEESLFVFKR